MRSAELSVAALFACLLSAPLGAQTLTEDQPPDQGQGLNQNPQTPHLHQVEWHNDLGDQGGGATSGAFFSTNPAPDAHEIGRKGGEAYYRTTLGPRGRNMTRRRQAHDGGGGDVGVGNPIGGPGRPIYHPGDGDGGGSPIGGPGGPSNPGNDGGSITGGGEPSGGDGNGGGSITGGGGPTGGGGGGGGGSYTGGGASGGGPGNFNGGTGCGGPGGPPCQGGGPGNFNGGTGCGGPGGPPCQGGHHLGGLGPGPAPQPNGGFWSWSGGGNGGGNPSNGGPHGRPPIHTQ